MQVVQQAEDLAARQAHLRGEVGRVELDQVELPGLEELARVVGRALGLLGVPLN